MAKNKIVEKIKAILFPHYSCVICGRETKDGKLCGSCEEFVIKPKYCTICGEHIGESDTLCIECKETKRNFDKSFSVFEYNKNTSVPILAMKFSEKRYLAKDFAKLLFEKWKECAQSADVVCFVPSSKKRLKQRGYNHAEDLAKEFSLLADIPCKSLLSKIKETGHQAVLSREQRMVNVKDSFSCADKSIKGKNVLVIDDVFTTGSTLDACAKALRKQKPNKIFCLTVAKTVINKA